jgi:glycerol-3-phosphate O-acyltransferase / dihydroxyacetone phosphate acyltransferase
MIYSLLKAIYKIGLMVFYKKFEVRNRHLIPEQGPLLVVSNHPNTFMDPIITATILDQPIYFIAKSTVFGSKVQNWLLRQMHLIPIHRREDNPDQQINNEEAFAESFKALAQGKALLIFPEGNSYNQRRLRKIKTGTARIALTAATDFNLPIKIIPIGLNYSASTRFQSDVFVNIGEPIDVSDYLHNDPQVSHSTVLALTEEIRNRLQRLIVHTHNDEQDQLAKQVEELFKDRLSMAIPATIPTHEHDFRLTKAIIKSINYYYQKAPERLIAIRNNINAYLLQLKRLELQDALLGKGEGDVISQSILGLLFLLLGIPFYLYGLLHNYIPYIIPSKVAKQVTKEEEWRAPLMLTVGIFSFPIFYSLEAWLLWKFLNPGLFWFALYLLPLPLRGFFPLGYWKNVLHTKEHWLLLMMFFKRQHVVEKLRYQRQQVITELEQARHDYLQDRQRAKS